MIRVEHFIVKGKTTKPEIIAEFGVPTTETVMHSDLPYAPYETIAYSKVYFSEVAILTIQLDRRGVVTSYTFTGTGPITKRLAVRRRSYNQAGDPPFVDVARSDFDDQAGAEGDEGGGAQGVLTARRDQAIVNLQD